VSEAILRWIAQDDYATCLGRHRFPSRVTWSVVRLGFTFRGKDGASLRCRSSEDPIISMSGSNFR